MTDIKLESEIKKPANGGTPDKIEHVVIIDPVSKPAKFIKKQTGKAVKQIKKIFK